MRNFGYFEDGQVGSPRDLGLWRRILGLTRGRRIHLAGAALLSLLSTAAVLLMPAILKWAVDGAMRASIPPSQGLALLARLSLAFLGAALTAFACTFVQIQLLEWTGQTVMHRLRQRLMAHLLTQDQAFFHARPGGSLVTRLTNDIQNMHEMFTSVLVTLGNDLLKMAGVLAALWWMNPDLARWVTPYLPLSLGITWVFSSLAREAFRGIRAALSRINTEVQEAATGISVIQGLGREGLFQERFNRASQDFLARTLRQINLFGSFMPLTELLNTSAIALILYAGGRAVLAGEMSLGALVAFLAYMRLFFQPMRELSQKYSIVQSALASAERIFTLLDREPAIRSPARPRPLPAPPLSMTLEGVWFGYRPDRPVLRGVDLELPAGEVTAVVGATGAGKTTLLHLLPRFHDPDQGRVLLGGRDLRDLDLGELRGAMGLVLQDLLVWPGTLRENLVMAGPDPGEAALGRILRQARLEDLVRGLPQGLDTPIGEGGQELSAGEKQLVALARILVRDPPVLLLDEATANIDTATEARIEEVLDTALSGRTCLLIAHRLSTARRATHIVVMEEGKIREQGGFEELRLLRDGLFARMLETDSRA